MTRQQNSLERTQALRQGWDELRACLEAFDTKVCDGNWHLATEQFTYKDIPADEFPMPGSDVLRRWYFATLATAGWIVTPRRPDERCKAGYYRVVSSQGYGWDSLLKQDPKEVA
jgi:hypothetical protein